MHVITSNAYAWWLISMAHFLVCVVRWQQDFGRNKIKTVEWKKKKTKSDKKKRYEKRKRFVFSRVSTDSVCLLASHICFLSYSSSVLVLPDVADRPNDENEFKKNRNKEEKKNVNIRWKITVLSFRINKINGNVVSINDQLIDRHHKNAYSQSSTKQQEIHRNQMKYTYIVFNGTETFRWWNSFANSSFAIISYYQMECWMEFLFVPFTFLTRQERGTFFNMEKGVANWRPFVTSNFSFITLIWQLSNGPKRTKG